MNEARVESLAEAHGLLVVSDGAAAKIAELISEDDGEGRYLRVYVTGGGCSGFQYGFALEESAQEDDACVRKGGAALLVDPLSLQYLIGAQIEYEEGLEGARFVIRNPNATSTCGCGSSFSV